MRARTHACAPHLTSRLGRGYGEGNAIVEINLGVAPVSGSTLTFSTCNLQTDIYYSAISIGLGCPTTQAAMNCQPSLNPSNYYGANTIFYCNGGTASPYGYGSLVSLTLTPSMGQFFYVVVGSYYGIVSCVPGLRACRCAATPTSPPPGPAPPPVRQ